MNSTTAAHAEVRRFRSTAFNVGFFSFLAFAVDYSFQIVDIYWVSKLGIGAATAMTVASSIFWLSMALNEVVGVGSASMIGQSIGRGDKDQISRLILQTIVLKFIAGIAIALLFGLLIFIAHEFYGLTPVEKRYLRDYSVIIWISGVLIPVYASMMTALRALGRAHMTTAAALAAAALNAIINPIAIYGSAYSPAFGIQGAAWATIFAQSVAMAICATMLARHGHGYRIFRVANLIWNTRLFAKMAYIGLPIAGISILYGSEQALLSWIIANFDSEISDGYGIGARIHAFFNHTFFGAALGISIAAGYSLGKGEPQVVWKSGPGTLAVFALCFTGLTTATFIFAPEVVSAFVTNPTSIETATTFVRYAMPTAVLVGLIICVDGVFQAGGYNIPPLLAACVTFICIEFPLLLLFRFYEVEYLPIFWLTLMFSNVIGFALVIRNYRRGSWARQVL